MVQIRARTQKIKILLCGCHNGLGRVILAISGPGSLIKGKEETFWVLGAQLLTVVCIRRVAKCYVMSWEVQFVQKIWSTCWGKKKRHRDIWHLMSILNWHTVRDKLRRLWNYNIESIHYLGPDSREGCRRRGDPPKSNRPASLWFCKCSAEKKEWTVRKLMLLNLISSHRTYIKNEQGEKGSPNQVFQWSCGCHANNDPAALLAFSVQNKNDNCIFWQQQKWSLKTSFITHWTNSHCFMQRKFMLTSKYKNQYKYKNGLFCLKRINPDTASL